jgi:hypothetical protein
VRKFTHPRFGLWCYWGAIAIVGHLERDKIMRRGWRPIS